jgi:hypothetical protein
MVDLGMIYQLVCRGIFLCHDHATCTQSNTRMSATTFCPFHACYFLDSNRIYTCSQYYLCKYFFYFRLAGSVLTVVHTADTSADTWMQMTVFGEHRTRRWKTTKVLFVTSCFQVSTRSTSALSRFLENPTVLETLNR